jgi:thiamine biosynthesis protein ThiS
MNVRLRVSGAYAKYLPGGGKDNRGEIEIDDGATPQLIMSRLGFPDGAYLISVNGTAVPKAERATRELEDGDELAILVPLRGG